MELKYLFGSKLLKLNNCRDEDWLIFVDSHSEARGQRGVRSIPFYNTLIEHFVNGNNDVDDFFKSCYLYQTSCGFFNDENYPFNHFNILEHKEVWINQLKGFMNLDTTKENALKSDILRKSFYHILYQYYMIKENTHWISDEAKANVQKIHDIEMPSSYFYELRDLINSL